MAYTYLPRAKLELLSETVTPVYHKIVDFPTCMPEDLEKVIGTSYFFA